MWLSNPAVSRTLYAAAVVANYILTQFAIELGKGKVPIPHEWEWTVPIISAAITALLMFLPRAGAEMVARQVDRLASRGVQKRDMIVQEHPDATARRVAAGAKLEALQDRPT